MEAGLAVGDVQSFGDRAQVGEVVQADPAYEPALLCRTDFLGSGQRR